MTGLRFGSDLKRERVKLYKRKKKEKKKSL
jgi:hypothetical protein